MLRERRLPRPPRRARRAGPGSGPSRRGRGLRRLLLALPVHLRQAVLGDPPPGWMDSSLFTLIVGGFQAIVSAGIVFVFGVLEESNDVLLSLSRILF